MRLWVLVVSVVCAVSFQSSAASAQLRPGSLRYGIDVDLFSAGAVWVRPTGAHSHTVARDVSIGPNQIGNSIATIPATPLGIAVDYVLRPKWMLGLRTGIGYDRVRSPDTDESVKQLALSFMPELVFVPWGGRVRPFAKFSPIMQFTQLKAGGDRAHMFSGCFSIGGGAFIFSGDHASIDLGAYFEGRFGELHGIYGSSVDVDDLRGVLRLGISIWS